MKKTTRGKRRGGRKSGTLVALIRNYQYAFTGGSSVLLGLFLLAASFNMAGIVGRWAIEYVRGVSVGAGDVWSFGSIGNVGSVALGIVLVILGGRLLRCKTLSYTQCIGAVLALVSLVVFTSPSFDLLGLSGGWLGNTVSEYMDLWFSKFSLLILPVFFVLGLWLAGLFPVALVQRVRAWYEKWREEYEYGEEEDGEEEVEEEVAVAVDEEEERTDEKLPEHNEKEKRKKNATSVLGRVKALGTDFAGAFTYSTETNRNDYTPPPVSLLTPPSAMKAKGRMNTTALSRDIERTFQTFGIPIQVEEVDVGPTVSRFAVKPAEGVRLARITGLKSNLELALAAHPIRIEAPIPGRSLVGIEVPNTTRGIVGLRGLLEDPDWTPDTMLLPAAIGQTVTGSLFACDIGKLPHLLIAGTTGSGKSVLVHSILMSLIYTRAPRDVRFILIDPKQVELSLYDGIPHLYSSVIIDPKAAVRALIWAVNEMERRYGILKEWRVRDLDSYRKARAQWMKKQPTGHEGTADGKSEGEGDNGNSEEGEKERGMPEIAPLIIVVDELADLMQIQPRELEASIVRLAQKSRAVGIHLILATQRPSVNVITGVVKANIPARVAMRVPSQVDARTILDTIGAETLLGHGDLLVRLSDAKKPVRVQGAFVSEEEVKKVVDAVIATHGRAIVDPNVSSGKTSDTSPNTTGNGSSAPSPSGTPTLADALGGNGTDEEDERYAEAREAVILAGRASTSLLQRKLKIGYSRAARLMDILEERAVVGPQSGSKPREVLEQSTVPDTDHEE